MLHVILPITLILCTSLSMNVYSITMSFIVLPLTIIGIPMNMSKYTLSSCLSLKPHTLILGPIRPNLSTLPMFLSSNPLTLIFNSTFEFHLSFLLRIFTSTIINSLISLLYVVIILSSIFSQVLGVLFRK